MKKLIFGAIIAFTFTACGGSETANEEVEEQINVEEVIELENATKKVDEGLKDLEENVNTLNNEVDSLLNGI